MSLQILCHVCRRPKVFVCPQDVNSSLYVYHEVLEGCGELVKPTEYTGLGQVRNGEFL